VKSLFSADQGVDPVESFVPEDPNSVCVTISAMVGPSDELGEEQFQLTVCTPGWLQSAVVAHGPLVGRHYLIVEEWNWAKISAVITELFEREVAEDWATLGERLGRVGRWEFEDYRE
jgi:Immunity protein 8